MNKMTGNVLGE